MSTARLSHLEQTTGTFKSISIISGRDAQLVRWVGLYFVAAIVYHIERTPVRKPFASSVNRVSMN
jgi:hypothetical protein